MKKLALIISALVLFAFSQSVNAQESTGDKELSTVKFKTNMHCAVNCKPRIEKEMSFEKGVKEVDADYETKTVTIKYRNDKNTDDKLQKAIEKMGYTCELINDDVKKEEVKKVE